MPLDNGRCCVADALSSIGPDSYDVPVTGYGTCTKNYHDYGLCRARGDDLEIVLHLMEQPIRAERYAG